MNAPRTQHTTRIRPPFYLAGGKKAGTCGLHRYLDADFVNRFRQDVEGRRFDQVQFSSWQDDERHSRHGVQPVLRLPLHRTFHLVCCEAVCDHGLLEPALDPRRITSAGFVIRRLAGGGQQAWMLEDGEALGWQQAPGEVRDPNLHRRLCASGVLHPEGNEPAYSGEETHPLHVLPATDNHGRRHTLLYGYVPLGGFYYERDPAAALDPASAEEVLAAAAEGLPWPFGFRKPLDRAWRPEHSLPVDRGRPSKPMFELLRLLVQRYHLGEVGVAGNEPLARYCAGLWFYDAAGLATIPGSGAWQEEARKQLAPWRRQNVFAYLQSCFARGGDNPLVRWLILQEKAADAAGGLDRLARLEPLPAGSGSGSLPHCLLLLEAEAQELRALLGQRLRDQTLARVKEIPLPKFGQGADDLYQLVPFVRFRNQQGREQIQWAGAEGRSISFRVAAPFDPEASRPALIQMPSLADLKRGLARGAAMLTPADTFNLLSSLKLNKGAGPDALPEGEPAAGTGIQWICSFSLPVITLVAMILLMIMISLLNIVFFWMPWVRICLPFPKMKRG